jgi:hypothetical protein
MAIDDATQPAARPETHRAAKAGPVMDRFHVRRSPVAMPGVMLPFRGRPRPDKNDATPVSARPGAAAGETVQAIVVYQSRKLFKLRKL